MKGPRQMPQTRWTRLAPSPTGALHLGNARTFLVNWAMARSSGWQVLLRVDDLDTPRTKPGADRQAVEDLAWLGLDWDAGPVYQMADLEPYREALLHLEKHGRVYPCRCTRRDIEEAQSAPHADSHELRYPGTCRPADGFAQRQGETDAPRATLGGSRDHPFAWRLIVPQEDVTFDDGVHGPQRMNVQHEVGDFIVATKAGLPAYQLASVVDDARQGITDVVRGDDLLGSAARQVLLYRLLGLGDPPRYWHLPLVVGPDGRRLAKRHGDTRVAAYREAGVPAERLIGLLGFWSGVSDRRRPMTAGEFREAFDIARLPRQAVTCNPEDHDWLMKGTE